MKNLLSNVSKTLKLVFSSAAKWSLINIIITSIQAIIPLISIYLMKLLIDTITIIVNSNVNNNENITYLILILTVFVFIFFLTGILNSLGNYVKEQQAMKVSDYMYNIIQNKAISLDLEYFENSAYHDKFFRAVNEAPFRPISIVNNIIRVFQNSISLLLIAGLLFFLHWSMGLIMIVATLPGLYVRIKYSKILYDWHKKSTPQERKAYYFNRVLTDIDFAKEIRLFGLGNMFINGFKEIRTFLRTQKLNISRKIMLTDIFTQLFSVIVIAFCYVYIIYKTINKDISIGDMVMYFLAFQRGLAFLRELLGGFANVYEDNLFVSNIYEFLNLKPKIVDVSKKKVLEFNFNKLIEFKNVAFAYPNSERNVFSNINLKIPYGKTIAIVGKNGIGKTTLIKLLCRLYDVNNGQILIDGIDIKNFNQTQLRKNISVIFQDFVLYNMSAEDNIWFGDITKTKNENDIRKAALDAGVDEVLSNLNNGYKTILGNLFDDSEELSIGEWQKIALARAFFKNANLLVLDEPTSAIDADTEFELFQKFKKITVGKTVIIISHRFSTVKLSDYIYVLGNEQIIEEGTHQELMKNNSFYAKMFNQQAQNFSNIL